MADPYTHVCVAAYTPFTGKGSGHDTVEKNIEDAKKALSLAVTEQKKLSDNSAKDNRVLSIVVAPEWTWKKKAGAYGPEDVAKIYTALQALSAQFPETLFFPGTVLWWIPGDMPKEALTKAYGTGEFKFIPSNLASKKGHTHLYNSAPVFLGGKLIHNLIEQFAGKAIHETKVDRFDFDEGPEKGREFWRTDDEKRRCTEVDWNGKVVPDAHIFTNPQLIQGSKKKSFILQLGLETARATVQKAVHKSGKKVDIQVLLSGGAGFDAAAFGTRTHGIALQCEGNTKDWKKLGLKIFPVEEPPEIPASTPNLAFRGDDKSPVVILPFYCRRPLQRHLMAVDPAKRPPKQRAEDYKAERRKVAKVGDEDLKAIFEKNLKLRAKWVKLAENAENAYWLELIKAGTWDSDAWKKHRKILDNAWEVTPMPAGKSDAFSVFEGSPIGVGLGFFIGVNFHLDSMFRSLGMLDDELFLLGNYLTDLDETRDTCTWIQGPLKKFKDAFEKTVFRGEYKGNANENKDLVRGTLVANTDDPKKNKELIPKLGEILTNICKPDYGIEIQGGKFAVPKEGDPLCCGYSGGNFKILFKGHPKVAFEENERRLGDVGPGWYAGQSPQNEHSGPIPAEVQINTREMMFSKHSNLLLLKMKVFKDDAAYSAHEKKYGFQGGLGHVFYEMARVAKDKSDKDGTAAAEMGREYHKVVRNDPGNIGPVELTKRLDAFGEKLTKTENKESWEKHYDPDWGKNKTLSSAAHSRKETW